MKLLKRILAGLLIFNFLFLWSCNTIKETHLEGDVLRVMTYNVHHCNPPEDPELIDVNRIAEVIKAQNADIVGLQEIDVNTERVGGIDQAALLAEKAGYPYYFFSKAIDFQGGEYGVMTLSKYPLKDTETYHLPKSKDPNEEQRVLNISTFELPNGQKYRFINTHLEAYNRDIRLKQIQEIIRISRDFDLPFIVAGDFNSQLGGVGMNMIDDAFKRSCQDCPITFEEDGEVGIIDYVVFNKKENFKVKSHTVFSDIKASDHFPIVVELIVK